MQVTVRGYPFDLDERLLGASASTVREQVAAYDRGERTDFDLDVTLPDGLVGEVMGAMLAIPYGETRTYGELAAEVGTGAVAVGQACGANPVPVVVPCHRIVGADSLGGFSAAGGPAAKRALLDHERGQRKLGDY